MSTLKTVSTPQPSLQFLLFFKVLANNQKLLGSVYGPAPAIRIDPHAPGTTEAFTGAAPLAPRAGVDRST